MFIRTDETNRVIFQSKYDLPNTIEINEPIPQPEEKAGKRALIYWTETEGFTVEYQDRPKTENERVEELEQSQSDQDDLLMDIMLGGM